MNFKEKFIEGNNFIFSPFGTIKPIRYVIYALILEILYKLSFSAATVFQKNTPILGWILFLIALLIVVLKAFNYKKRFQDFIGNNIIAVTLTTIYISIGAFIQEYLYLLKLSVNKSAYELSANVEGYSQYQSTFQDYANINIPSFIGSNWGQSVFYLVTAVGFIMFLFLLFKKTKRNDSINITIKDNNSSENTTNKSSISLKKTVIIPSIILYFILVGVSYSEIHWRAYNWMHYYMTKDEMNYANILKQSDYDEALKEYNDNQQEWYDCLKNNPDYNDRVHRCGFSPKKSLSKPEVPYYYKPEHPDEYPYNVLQKGDFDYFKCTEENFSLFSNKCGDLKFSNNNRIYFNFHPYGLLASALIFLLPLSICFCYVIEKILTLFVKNIKKINFKSQKINILKIFKRKSNLTEKLQELNSLKEQGLITEEDYNLAKKNLLEKFN